MDTRLTISYQGLDGTPLLARLIEDHVDRLRQHCDQISAVDVLVELEQKELRSGSNYRVRVNVIVPPREDLVADYQPAETEPPVPLQAAVQRAFAHAEQQVDAWVTQRHDARLVDG